MTRRHFIGASLAAPFVDTFAGAPGGGGPGSGFAPLVEAVGRGVVRSAVMHVAFPDSGRRANVTEAFGTAASKEAMFLLGSISKPIVVTGLMALFDKGEFVLDDPVCRFLPSFSGGGREKVTIRHLLSHASGLPDQLPENAELRRNHAPLSVFVERTLRLPLHFSPGSQFEYSSMGIMLAARIAELISGLDVRAFTQEFVFNPLGMQRSALGLGKFKLSDFELVQTEHAAPEAGGGDPSAKDWDWNSPYWRQLGSPWGGLHASAENVARVLESLLLETGAVVKPETARLMLQNHNRAGQTPRGLGWNVGEAAGSPGCSEKTFGHTGSTGTIAWADRSSGCVCVVLTSLPARAVSPHPKESASAAFAAFAKQGQR